MGIDAGSLAAIIFSVLGAALLIGVPIGYSLGLATAVGLYFSPIPLIYIAQTLYTGTELFPLIAIPGFVLAGDLMIRARVTDKLIRVVFLLVGNIPGGLGVVTIVACGLFASISGSGPATTAAIGGIMIAAMVRASLRVRWKARADRPSLSIASPSSWRPPDGSTQSFFIAPWSSRAFGWPWRCIWRCQAAFTRQRTVAVSSATFARPPSSSPWGRPPT